MKKKWNQMIEVHAPWGFIQGYTFWYLSKCRKKLQKANKIHWVRNYIHSNIMHIIWYLVNLSIFLSDLFCFPFSYRSEKKQQKINKKHKLCGCIV